MRSHFPSCFGGLLLAGFLVPAVSAATNATATGVLPPPPADHAAFLKAGAARNGRPDRSRVTETDRQWWAFQPLNRVAPPRTGERVHLESVMDVGRLPSGGDVKAPAEGSGPTFVTASSRSTPRGTSVGNPIDAFLRARLEAAGLKPNPPADRRRQLRRAAFDLVGMPPTAEETAAYLNDPSPDAWARQVRRLLDSPRHGERWARHWLDVARFAESSGFEHDYDRPNAFHYRDFVIQALNTDMPYDQFVRWQVAGDEFEPDNPRALMATGFLGAGVFPTQITLNEVERTRYDAMDDMLSTTTSAMLGLTVGCARCHDHKFDPIPTQDYYRLLSTFTTTVRSNVDLDLDPEGHRRAKQQFEREHAPLVAALSDYEQRGLGPKFDTWIAAGAPGTPIATWEQSAFDVATSRAGATLRLLDDGSFLAEGKNGDSDLYTFATTVRTPGLRAVRVEALAHPSMPRGGPGRADNANIGLSRIRVFASPAGGGPTNEIRLVRARATFEQNTSNLAVASALDDNPKTGWAIDPKFGVDHAAVFDFEQPLTIPGPVRLEVRLEFDLNTRHHIGRPRLTFSSAVNPGLTNNAMPAEVATLLDDLRTQRRTASSMAAADRTVLLDWWKKSEPGWRESSARVEEHTRRQPKPALTKVLVCAEGYPALRMNTQGADFFNETHFLLRGSTDSKREVVTPGFLQVLGEDAPDRWQSPPPSGAKFSGRRRALAQWMTDVDHGAGRLLARVIVNRLWQHHFGQGLVSTPNDFGTQGSKPSHPELLDWLATELIRNGWRLKPIHHLLLTSETYLQESTADPARLQADPSNVLLSRWTPRRLEAEAVRDSLLAVAGVLDQTRFGPGTLDPASRRRSVYFTVKRSQMVGAMQAFDAPEPLVSQGTRPTTTVAPQALWLMNNPHVRSWAVAFARRLDAGPGQPVAATVARGYTLALNRLPTSVEADDGAAFLRSQIERYRAAGKPDARELALADFAQVILSLNEFIYAD